jgi:hypothetical protein
LNRSGALPFKYLNYLALGTSTDFTPAFREGIGIVPTVIFQPVTMATRYSDNDGRLVLVDGELAAVLVLLEHQVHDEHRGMWFVEAAFGDFEDGLHEVFADLDAAAEWFGRRTPIH